MNSEIAAAFFTLIDDAGLGLPISFQGVKFTPPDSGQWLEVSHLPNTGLDQSLSTSSVLKQGLFQVNVCNRPNTGLIPLQETAETVMALFPKTTIISGLARVSNTPYSSSLLSLDDRIMIPVTISYSE